MTLRKIVFWLHLIAGVFAGTVVFIMSVTGLALTYQKQMTEWADRSYWPAAAPAGGEKLTVEALLAKAVEAQPAGKPSAITFYSDPAAPAMVAAPAPAGNVFVNRHTGETAVGGSTAMRSFFRLMTDWHRYVGASGENRATGKAITGASNLAFLFIVVSGIYLWWPRSWTPQALRGITWFKRGARGRARDFNWHNTFGFWTAVPLFFIVLSGVVISYPWASSMIYKITGSPEPVRGGQQRGAQARGGERREAGGSPAPEQAAPLNLAQADAFLSRVEQETPGWRTITLRLPAPADPQMTFSTDKSGGGRPQMRSTLVFDQGSGEIARRQTFADQTTGERARSWMRFLHTGEFYGLFGQTIAGVACGAGAMLVFTGLALSIRRFLAWAARARRSREIVLVGSSVGQENQP